MYQLLAFCVLTVATLGQRSTTAPVSPTQETSKLISQLGAYQWEAPKVVSIPIQWDYSFTPPMDKILEIGAAAQGALITALSAHPRDPKTRAQLILLLGGVGDERAVEPIIAAMVGPDEFLRAERESAPINLCADLALTNITVADAIWKRVGGSYVDTDLSVSKPRWEAWWSENRATFTVKGITTSRNYPNYPNYGIYRQKR